jgi:hypothetical protein
VADAGDLPAPRTFVGADAYQGGLDEHQQYATNLTLTRFENGGPAVLLADGPGVGKTRTELAVADQYKRATGRPVLILTENRQIIAGSFTSDAKAMGLNLADFEVKTYTDLSRDKLDHDSYGLVVFDEAHNLKNVHSQKAIAGHALKTDHKLFATGTPLDRPVSAAYFLAEISGLPVETIERRMGFHVVRGEDAYGEPTAHAELDEGMTWERAIDNMLDIRRQAVQAGALLRREYPFFGTIDYKGFQLGA